RRPLLPISVGSEFCLRLRAERLQLLSLMRRQFLLRLRPLHRPLEAVLRLRWLAELDVAHGEEVKVEGAGATPCGGEALLEGVGGLGVQPVAVLGHAERVDY